MWEEALKDPGYYAYLANVAGAVVGNLPKKGAVNGSPKGNDKCYSHNYKYSERIKARSVDASHRFPYSFDDITLSSKPINRPNNYKIYQIPGSMNGRDGVYEIGINKRNTIDHRFFRPLKEKKK